MRMHSKLGLVVVALSMAGCGSGSSSPSSPTSTNHAPVFASATVSPAFGVSGLTSFTMSAAASDADGDSLTYTWAFGGGSSAGASTVAKITGDGATAVQVTVSDGHGGTATNSGTVTIGTMTGSWDFVAGNCGTDPREAHGVFTLTQTGTAVTGSLTFPGHWCEVNPGTHSEIPAVSPGSIDAQGNFALPRVAVGAFLDVRLQNGKMDSTGRKVTGQVFDSGFTGESFTLTKR